MSMIPRMAHLLKGSAAIPPTLLLNFLTGALDPRITFSRGSQAMLTDSTGKITYAPNNLLTNSESFDAASWTKSAATITANTATAPDGTTTADKLVEDTATSTHNVRSGSISIVSGANYNASVYVSAAGRTRVQLVSFNGVSDVITTFDLTAGSVVSGSGSIASVGGGWFRISQFFTAAATVSTPYAFQIFLVSTGTTTSYTGNGTSGVNIWGAQFDAVTYQTTPRTYLPTTTAAYYGPRFDYDPVTLAPKGLLIEEQRTNLLTYSEQFDNAAWTKENATVTANAATSPDGTSTADKFVPGTGSVNHDLYNTTAATITNGALVTASVYVKAAGYGFATVNLVTNLARQVVVVNLSTGAITQNSSFGSPTNVTYSATSVGNGWYRVTVSFTSTGTTGYLVAGCSPTGTATLDVNLNPVFAGDGTSGIYIWGAQLEAGAFATSYIPTTAAQVTRSADVASMTGTNFSSWYNQIEGVIVAQYSSYVSTNTSLSKAIFGASDGTNNNRIYGNVNTAGIDFLFVSAGATTQANISTATVIADNATGKLAAAYAVDNFAAVVNGGTAGTDTSGTVPTVDRLSIGNLNGFSQLNGHIRIINYYNKRLSNNQLQRLTA